jgi:hypothetical protein
MGDNLPPVIQFFRTYDWGACYFNGECIWQGSDTEGLPDFLDQLFLRLMIVVTMPPEIYVGSEKFHDINHIFPDKMEDVINGKM